MQANLIAIGNSQGIILPARLLRALGIKDKLELEVAQDALMLRPTHPRAQWETAFKAMAAAGDDQMLMDNVFEDESFEQW
ncbi:MAG: AbrB/MazE/SpoVT family DNA-binding domain-containing protein [Roseivirga sp.]